jgi:hypothetical protein
MDSLSSEALEAYRFIGNDGKEILPRAEEISV